MLEDRGRCGWGAVVVAVTLFATLLLVTPAARATAAPEPGSVAVARLRQTDGVRSVTVDAGLRP